MDTETKEKFKGCILGGAIGDAWGSGYENLQVADSGTFYVGKQPKAEIPAWTLTDDTILTVATCEALQSGICTPELLAGKFVEYFKRKEIIGIGASTLKALTELEAGGHWSQVGRKGEHAAGNGSAMRIAPFAFYEQYTKEDIYGFSKITHNNDEAYAGSLAIFLAVRHTLRQNWKGAHELFEILIDELPDTRLRDRMIEIKDFHLHKPISELAKLGHDGYVVNSIPFAIGAASKITEINFEEIISQIVQSGGDTDTNASLAGQIMGTRLGYSHLPRHLLQRLEHLRHFDKIGEIILK